MHDGIAVRLVANRLGCSRIRYAADLAKRIRANLFVLAPSGDCNLTDVDFVRYTESVFLKGLIQGSVGNLDAEVALGSPEALKSWMGRYGRITAVTGLGDDDIFQSVSRIYSADEHQVCRSSETRLVVPIGRNPPSESLIETVKGLAGRLGAQVTIYHTTWPDPKLPPNSEALFHMVPEARVAAAEFAKRLSPVSTQLSVEMAPAVTAGIHQHALRRGACLIVMTPGERVVRGSYAEELIHRSSVPVLFVSREVCQ